MQRKSLHYEHIETTELQKFMKVGLLSSSQPTQTLPFHEICKKLRKWGLCYWKLSKWGTVLQFINDSLFSWHILRHRRSIGTTPTSFDLASEFNLCFNFMGDLNFEELVLQKSISDETHTYVEKENWHVNWWFTFFGRFLSCYAHIRLNESKLILKLYIPSTLNIDLILWHTKLIVCRKC